MARTVALAACLILAALVAWLGERPPAPLPASAAPDVFSAARAMSDVEVIAPAPHPIGSPANAAVRDHLLRRMTALGLQPQLFSEPALFETQVADRILVIGARPETIVGVLPGREPAAPAVALMAHYDSVPSSPGAADDAAGVAAVLETVRALKTKGPQRRDVVVVLTDGEEAGLLGARAFFAGHPQARRLGFVINLEARGGAGRARMFQTGAANGETIALFRRAVPSASSSSLATFLFEIMPNDTDFTLARAGGLPGLNFAFVGGQFDYHAASSTPANLDKGSLQDLGAQALAATRAAADAPALPRPAPDLVYNQLPGGYVAAYPAPAGWLALAAAAALLITGFSQARGKGRFTTPDALRGAGAGLFLFTAGATLFRAARRVSGAGFGELEQRRLLAHAETFELALVLLAIGLMLYTAAELARGRRGVLWVPVAAGLAGGFAAGFDPLSLGLGAAAAAIGFVALRRPATIAGAWAGLLVTGFAAACALQAFAPLAAPILAWPLLIASAAAALTCLWTWRPLCTRGLVFLAAALTLGWLGGFVHGIYQGLDAPELLAAPLWIAALVVWPLAQPDRKGAGTPFVSVSVLVAGLAVLAFVRFAEPWSPRRPEASQVAYLVDRKAQKAFRLSLTPERPAWADAVLAADGGRVIARAAPPLTGRTVDAAQAKPVAAPAPQFSLAQAEDGRVVLHVAAPPGTSLTALDFTADAPVSAVTVAGRPSRLLAGPSRSGHLRWRGDARDLEIAFRPGQARALNLRYGLVTPGWPADAKPLPPRPAQVMAYDLSDALFTTGEERLTWPAGWAKPLP